MRAFYLRLSCYNLVVSKDNRVCALAIWILADAGIDDTVFHIGNDFICCIEANQFDLILQIKVPG